ncbi:FidL-like protein [Kluyvera ascorbata]|uniref:FidL-like protein n=1 Tax=Kluyvera ascorbata TaxID=51288 RepID=UPI00330974DA|nr:hypothetical protein [Kluyvera ascorbata]
MKYSRRIIITAVTAGFILAVLFVSFFIRYKHVYPFKCYSFTHYDLSRIPDDTFDMFLTQDLRIQDEEGGYLLLNGDVVKNNVKTYLSRTIVFGKGSKIDSDTFRYQITGTKVSLSDNTPSMYFNQLLTEFTSDQDLLQLDVIRLQGQTFLVGGPLSYLFTCERY